MPSSNSNATGATTVAIACAASAAVASLATYVIVSKRADAAAAAAAAAALRGPLAATDSESRKIYETENSTRQYLDFHYTPGCVNFTRSLTQLSEAFDFPTRVAQLFAKHRPRHAGVALDLGCSVGASAFEMSRTFARVIGLDLSESFIKYATLIKENRQLDFEAPEQGFRTVKRVARLADDIDSSKVTFVVGDALNVDPSLGTFDGLLVANLLCRVPNPRALLASFSRLVNKGGILVIASPYSWWEGATSSDQWIGGHDGDKPSDVLAKAILAVDFELLDEHDEPFLLRDHTRRYQIGFSHTTVWRRK